MPFEALSDLILNRRQKSSKKINKYFNTLKEVVTYLTTEYNLDPNWISMPTSESITFHTPIHAPLLNGKEQYSLAHLVTYKTIPYSFFSLKTKQNMTEDYKLEVTGYELEILITPEELKEYLEDIKSYMKTRILNSVSLNLLGVNRSAIMSTQFDPYLLSLIKASDELGWENKEARFYQVTKGSLFRTLKNFSTVDNRDLEESILQLFKEDKTYIIKELKYV